MAERFSNKAQTTLSTGIDSDDTSITVASATGFPPSGNFRIFIKAEGANTDEICTVTGVSGTTWTISRASEAIGGTQAASSHASGAEVIHVLTAGAVEQLAGINYTWDDTTTTAGIDQNRNTSSSFTYQRQGIQVLSTPMLLTEVLWDIRNTGDYTLTILDEGQTQTLATVGPKTVSSAPSADESFVLSSTLTLEAGTRYVFKMARSGSTTWSDNSASSYQVFSHYLHYYFTYDTTDYTDTYSGPMKLKYYASVLLFSEQLTNIVKGQIDTTASTYISIPGLSGSPDIRVAGTNDDEFDTTDTSDPMTGWTTLGTPTSHNINSTAKSHYYLSKSAAAGVNWVGIYKTSPSTPFTVKCKLSDASIRADYNKVGLFIGESTPGKIVAVTFQSNSGINKVAVDIYSNPTTYSSTPVSALAMGGIPVYFKIIATSNTSVAFYYSEGGLAWRELITGVNPSMTIGSVGLGGGSENSTYGIEAFFDWIRFS